MVGCRGSGLKRKQLGLSLKPKKKKKNLQPDKQLCLDSASPGSVCDHHYRSLRLVDFTATPLEEPGSERNTAVRPAVKPAGGQVSGPCVRGGNRLSDWDSAGRQTGAFTVYIQCMDGIRYLYLLFIDIDTCGYII